MAQNFTPGDFLVFQLESGYGLLRVIAVDNDEDNTVWHLAGYDEFFLDVDSAEAAIARQNPPKPSHDHIAITNRAFESTQVARLTNVPLEDIDRSSYIRWIADPGHEVSDRSVRLMMGFR
ncbi:MAG: hypothetical protein ABJA02_14715 [Acidobacteriota bacterium]